MDELMEQKQNLEKELDMMPKLARARKTKAANITGMCFFSFAMVLFSMTMLIEFIELLDQGITRKEFYTVNFAMLLIIDMPIVILGAALMLSYKPGMNLAYSLSAGIAWPVQIILDIVLYEVFASPEKYGIGILIIISFVIFYMITPVLLFALTYPPFHGNDMKREALYARNEVLLSYYYNLATQMELVSPSIALEMHDKYAEYEERRF